MAPTRYELRVQGRLSPDVSRDFEEFDVSEAPVETVLLGEVVDGAHLHGVLARLESFGLQIVSPARDAEVGGTTVKEVG